MADIIDLIARQGKGGQTYPARMAQMAQARETEQRTEDMSVLRQQQAEQNRRAMANKQEMEDIGRSSTTTEEFMQKLQTAGRHEEYLKFKELANSISESTANIDKLDRAAEKEEAVAFGNTLVGVKDQTGFDKAIRIHLERFKNSKILDWVNPQYDPELISMYRFGALASSESIDLQEMQDKQGRQRDLKIVGAVMEDATKETYSEKRDMLNKYIPGSPILSTLPEEFDQEYLSGLSDASKTSHQVALERIGQEKVDVQREKMQLTKQDRIIKNRRLTAKYQEQVVDDTELLKRLGDTTKLIKENPTSVGAIGALKNSIAGMVGQLGAPGRWAETLIQSEEDIQVHGGIALLDGILIPRVLNDTSGRYSDADMDRVREINSGREWIKSPRQTVAMLDELIEITKRGRENTKKMIADPAYDPNYPTKEAPETATATGKKSKFRHLWTKEK